MSTIGSTDAYDELMQDYMQFCVSEDQFMNDVRAFCDYQPRSIWGQLKNRYTKLAPVMIKVYSGPGSTAGVERQHKVGKRVHSSRRNRSGVGKVERQVAVTHNASVYNMKLPAKRQRFEQLISALGKQVEEGEKDPAPLLDELNGAAERLQRVEDGEGDDDDDLDPVVLLLNEWELLEQDDLERVIPAGGLAQDILDDILFPESQPRDMD
jgi:hypothetical protein